MNRTALVHTLMLLLPLLMTPSASGAGAFEGTFLQLLEHHRDWGDDRWGRLLDEMSALGVEEIVVQWTEHDGVSFAPALGTGVEQSTLGRLLTAADERGARIVLGLVHDTGFWEWIAPEREARLVEVSLRRLEERHERLAREIVGVASSHTSFAGWYLPEEIDDRSWLADPRRRVLSGHLRRIRERLDRLTPGSPVAVSGFSNAFADPETLARFWAEVVDGSGIDRVLFQDGVGAGKLAVSEVPIVLGPLAAALRDRPTRFQVVVELFRQIAGPPLDEGAFRAVTAPSERIREQIAVAGALSEGGVFAFAIPEYLSSEAGVEARAVAVELSGEE